jgi:hypothetical protein
MSFEVDQKVRVRYVDATDRVIWFDGKVLRQETIANAPPHWRVDIGGVAIAFAEEDIHPEGEQPA